MFEPVFFEIPIYRISNKKYLEEMNSMREKYYSNYPGVKEGIYFESFKNLIEQQHWYPWRYNEVIGYLNLYIFGSQFRIDYWLVSNQRINKGIRKKKFVYWGKTYEATIRKNKNSAEIFEWILEQLEKLQNERRFKKRYFDLRTFKVVGKFIDWQTLCNELNSWKNPEFRIKYFNNKL